MSTTVALGSAKSSPGASTTALALAHVWPAGRSVVLAEADPAGGSWAGQLGVAFEPGLLGLLTPP